MLPSSSPVTSAPFAVRFWILFCAYWNCAGWLLSALGMLNRAGYAVATVIGIGLLIVGWRQSPPRFPGRARWQRRFQRPFPLAFLLVASLAILGGCLYAPSNPDGLTHRVPRLLNWLAEGRWHWIENAPTSFNTRVTGFEWTMAPLISLTGTDRFVFLLNAFALLLLPGLVFSVFHRVGVRRRVAWAWMWIVPTGYCFLLQAGSIANDLAGAVLALAALDFALRARLSGRLTEVWLSILAAALMTNAKSSNLTLLLPWGLALLPSLKRLLSRPVATLGVSLVAALISLLPVTYFNIQKYGEWTGSAAEAPIFENLTPPIAFAGNAVNLAAQNFVPPVFPLAGWWNEHFHRLFPASFIKRLESCFEPGGAHFKLLEMQLEVAAGLGFGVSLLVLISCTWGFLSRTPAPGPTDQLARLIRWSAWLCLLVYMVKTGLSTSARIITPYYCLLLPLLLAGSGHETVVRRRSWRALGMCVFLVAAILIAMNPGRPLWPARAFFAALSDHRPQSRSLKKAALLYDSYAQRWDALWQVRRHLPADAKNVGLISFISASSIETSLWRPFGSRRIWWLRPGTSRAEMDRKGIQYVVIGSDGPEARKGDLVFSDWLKQWVHDQGASKITRENVRLLATGEPQPWYVIQLGTPAASK